MTEAELAVAHGKFEALDLAYEVVRAFQMKSAMIKNYSREYFDGVGQAVSILSSLSLDAEVAMDGS